MTKLERINFLLNEIEYLQYDPSYNLRDIYLEELIQLLCDLDYSNIYVMSYDSDGVTHFITVTLSSIDNLINKLKSFLDVKTKINIGSDVIDELELDVVTNMKLEMVNKKCNNDGGLFPYYHELDIDLSKYQIYSKCQLNNKREHCFIQAIVQSKLFTEYEITTVKSMILGNYLTKVALNKIAKLLDIKVCLTELLVKNKKKYFYLGNKKSNRQLHIALVNNHYFINDIVNYHLFYLRNYNDTAVKNDPKKFMIKTYCNRFRRYRKYTTNILDFVIQMFKLNLFHPITLKDVKNVWSVDQIPMCINQNDIYFKEVKANRCETYEYYAFSDFETVTDTRFHEAYLCCWIVLNKHNQIIKEGSSVGEQCSYDFLNIIPDRTCVYFHNLKYDWSQLFDKLSMISAVEQNNNIYQINALYRGKYISFRDSYKMISVPLKCFSKIFDLDIHKEIMPYQLYTSHNVKLFNVSIKEALKFIDDKDKHTFIQNIQFYKTSDKKFKHLKYAEFYCKRDVEVLYKGFMKFREWCLDSLQMDTFDYITNASLADNYLIKQGCYEGVSYLTGTIRKFVQQAVIGGRVHVKDNKKWIITEPMIDLDAVSLYPSAMVRIPGLPLGLPKLINDFDSIDKYHYYIVEIKIINVNKTLDIPSINYKDHDNKRIWTNDIPNDNIIIDKLMLEDIIYLHDIQFEFIRGVYWNEGFNNKICYKIDEVFKLRKKYKQEDNPIQEVYKLIMNSVYGKMVMKETETRVVFIKGDDNMNRYLSKNYNQIKSYTKLTNNLYKITRYQSFLNHKNRAHCGSIILSMSKRIINRVIDVASKINVSIYYTDTDSLHFLKSDLERLEQQFYKQYDTKLIGDDLGQFHNEFGNMYSKLAVIVTKKIYLYVLQNNKYHIRCKSIPTDVILDYVNKYYNGDIKQLYIQNKIIQFNLCKCFRYKNYKVYNMKLIKSINFGQT